MNTRRKRKARKTKRGGVGELYMMAGAITLFKPCDFNARIFWIVSMSGERETDRLGILTSVNDFRHLVQISCIPRQREQEIRQSVDVDIAMLDPRPSRCF